MNTKTLPPPSEVRLTIPVSADVHKAFSRIAKAGNMPVGRAMGEWLGDTLDAAKFLAEKMEQARAAPKIVAQELHSYALGMTDLTGEMLRKMREGGDSTKSDPSPLSPLTPPPSNTGGKVVGANIKNKRNITKGNK